MSGKIMFSSVNRIISTTNVSIVSLFAHLANGCISAANLSRTASRYIERSTTKCTKLMHCMLKGFLCLMVTWGWLGSRVVTVLD